MTQNRVEIEIVKVETNLERNQSVVTWRINPKPSGLGYWGWYGLTNLKDYIFRLDPSIDDYAKQDTRMPLDFIPGGKKFRDLTPCQI